MIIALCDMPTGIGGLNGLTRWAVLDEHDASKRVPPLIPNKLLKVLDAVIEPKHCKMTLREANLEVELEELPSEPHTTSLMTFDPEGWSLPDDLMNEYDNDVFRWSSGSEKQYLGDPRLCVDTLVENISHCIDIRVFSKIVFRRFLRAPVIFLKFFKSEVNLRLNSSDT